MVALELLPKNIDCRFVARQVRKAATKCNEAIDFKGGWTRLLEALTENNRGVSDERVDELESALGVDLVDELQSALAVDPV